MSVAIFGKNRSSHAKSTPEFDGLVYVSTHQLIQLHHAAQSLPLKVAKVRALQSGEYYSPFRGRGMEFDEVRLYQPGDDVRTLDWRVTARYGVPHTKLFQEERERPVLLVVHYSAKNGNVPCWCGQTFEPPCFLPLAEYSSLCSLRKPPRYWPGVRTISGIE